MFSWRLPLTLLVFALLGGCGGGVQRFCPTESPGARGDRGQEAAPSSSATPLSPEEARARWSSGPHAGQVEESLEGESPDCLRCHAPLAWSLPTEGTAEDRAEIAFVASASGDPAGEVPGVPCAVCHPLRGEEVSRQVAWLEDPAVGTYLEVAVPEEVCVRCHSNPDLEGHIPVLLGGAHAEEACTDCHDPHDASASCTGSGCHQPFQAECEPIPTHDKPHASVSCLGCHASGEHTIGWDGGRGLWVTMVEIEVAGEPKLVPFPSHEIILEVDCDRCHTPGNLPWASEAGGF